MHNFVSGCPVDYICMHQILSLLATPFSANPSHSPMHFSFFFIFFIYDNLCLHYMSPLFLSSACQSTIHCHIVPVTMWPLWCSQSTIQCQSPIQCHAVPVTMWPHWCSLGVGIAQWLEHQTWAQRILGSSPCRRGRRILFSRVNFLCWHLFRYLFHPVLLQY